MRIIFLDERSMGDDVSFDEIKALGDYASYAYCDQKFVVEYSQDAEILITNKCRFTRDVLSRLSKLRLVCVTATGYDNIDILAAQEHGIEVRNVSGYSTESVVQHTFAMLLYLTEHLRFYDEYVRNGEYERHHSFSYFSNTFTELHGKRFGVVGMGAIGRRVAAVAQAFGAEVAWASVGGVKRDEGYTQMSIVDLCAWADVISIHSPLTPQSRDCISHEELVCMKPTTILINVGRGGIVNEDALTRAVQESRIGGIGLDVLSEEPIRASNPLQAVLKYPNVLITPHMAWGSYEARSRLIHEVAVNIKDFLSGGQRNKIMG